ncbi:MAG: response regulator transcription factor, partial [bacterium]
AGACGYVGRNAGGARLAAALRAVAAGLQVSEPADHPHDEPPEHEADVPVEELTPRELEVLQLLAEGLPNKGIARRLRISEHTVKFHITAIMSKLNTHSRTETVTRAARAGLILL